MDLDMLCTNEDFALQLQAAEEIKRLRRDRLDCQLVMDSQQAEIERLRAVLQGLLDKHRECADWTSFYL